jgi:hypothetical protein
MRFFKGDSIRLSVISMILGIFVFNVAALPSRAQQGSATSSAQSNKSADKKDTFEFKPPDGYMPLEFESYDGVVMLHPKKPVGIFILHVRDGQTVDDLCKQVYSSIARMFLHDSSLEQDWVTSSLPAHEGISNETGKLSQASGNEQEIQVMVYTRTMAVGEVLYGYFAMRSKSSKGKDSKGVFADGAGKGVKDFDKFWKTIRDPK